MSVDVLREVFRLSQSRGVARNVLTVLADAAHPDGVTWLPIVPSKNGDPTKCITHRANASKRAVIDAVAELAAAGEIEVRKAQRGRARISVYRVVLGAVGWTPVDYSDMPFTLEHPFGDGVQDTHLVLNKETPNDGVQFSDDEVQISFRRGADFVDAEEPIRPADAGDSSVPAAPEPSREPSSYPAADQNLEIPAAEDIPASDREIAELVLELPGADSGSPRVVIPEAHSLPRSVVFEVIAKVRARRGGVGLLVDLLRIARAERTAAISSALARELGQTARAYVPAPWHLDSLKRDDPERYVRVMASIPTFPLELLDESFNGFIPTDLLDLARRVRAGLEPGDCIGTPAKERLRWVEANARTDDAHAVIDAWDDVDDVERQELHERADAIRDDTKRRAA